MTEFSFVSPWINILEQPCLLGSFNFAAVTPMWWICIFCAILQKALQIRDAASVAAAEALQEASAAESVLRTLR